MIVVSDTSPISNLLIIDRLELLRNLYERVVIPTAVAAELKAIEHHRRALDSFDWINVVGLKNRGLFKSLSQTLDIGEAEAIALSVEISSDIVLIDELDGRREAGKLGLNVIGLMGVLVEAKREGFIDRIKPEVERLVSDASFWISPKLISEVLEEAGEK